MFVGFCCRFCASHNASTQESALEGCRSFGSGPFCWFVAARSFLGSVTATTRLDQQLSHALDCLVIFDVFRVFGVNTCLAASFRSSLAQRVSDALVHARAPSVPAADLAARARPSLYCAMSASSVNSFSTGIDSHREYGQSVLGGATAPGTA